MYLVELKMKKKLFVAIRIAIFLVLFSCVFSTFTSSVNALSLLEFYGCSSIIEIEYDGKIANDPFLPVDRVKQIPVSINYYVKGVWAEYVYRAYLNTPAFIDLSIDQKPDWCEVSLSPNFIKKVGTTEGTIQNVSLILKIDKDAHAMAQGSITINATVERVGALLGGSFYTNISFIPGYYPLLNINTKEDTVQNIGPLDTTHFDIEIENLGNAKTVIQSEILDIPEGWTVTIPNETVLGTPSIGDNPKKTISLQVRPSYAFGYHNEIKKIQISFTPSLFNNQSIKGEKYNVSFIVQNKGFSTPGFELFYVLVGLSSISIIIRKKKIKRNIQGGKRGDAR